MDKIVLYLVILLCSIFQCTEMRFLDQILDYKEDKDEYRPSRRYLDLHEVGNIIGSPSMPSHLPEAEPILPGHTLIRPALGMLKSAVKFPHKELENGAGVYGGPASLGITYDSRNERVLYSGFRRTPADYIVVTPVKTKVSKPKFVISSVVLDLDNDKNVYQNLLRKLKNIKKTKNQRDKRIVKIFSKKKLKRSRPKTPTREVKLKYPKLYASFYKKPLRAAEKKNNLREDDDDVSLEEDVLVNDSAQNPLESLHQQSEEGQEIKQKQKWFWDTKDLFSHIKIHQDAPDYNDLMPANVSKSIRNWWFYHQDDYEPFTSNTI